MSRAHDFGRSHTKIFASNTDPTTIRSPATAAVLDPESSVPSSRSTSSTVFAFGSMRKLSPACHAVLAELTSAGQGKAGCLQ